MINHRTASARANSFTSVIVAIGAAGVLCLTAPAPAAARGTAARAVPEAIPDPDLSGRARFGKASFYAIIFAGRKMADGTPMRPLADNAASKTLPLGTIARVTNLETGMSAVVTIRDRGPFVIGRIVDLSPGTARKIGLDRTGIAEVVVIPIAVPMPDGGFKPGEAAGNRNAADIDIAQ
jgi:rare lipoprotein A